MQLQYPPTIVWSCVHCKLPTVYDGGINPSFIICFIHYILDDIYQSNKCETHFGFGKCPRYNAFEKGL
jgi:hypothetical protein